MFSQRQKNMCHSITLRLRKVYVPMYARIYVCVSVHLNEHHNAKPSFFHVPGVSTTLYGHGAGNFVNLHRPLGLLSSG